MFSQRLFTLTEIPIYRWIGMTKRKKSIPESQSAIVSEKGIREQKIMNAVLNTSIILMGTLMGGFSEMMVKVTGALATGLAEAFGDEKAGRKTSSEMSQALPKVSDEMKKMMSDMRKDMYAQMEEKKKEIEPFLSDVTFDKGPQLIESYDFGLPKLIEQLDDETLAQYSYLLTNEDAKFVKLFGELTDWLQSLPSLPKKN